ncbi:Tol-Pal system subunit TolA [Campylobacter blaseri]|uniref:TonB C-terminal domain-containing protein n=1 Tax=Campylobacter blaseri TaxID=2042961 RepID=A0A2P8QZC0_9BACT|nr:TonB C-terminal domain-containing protein [Campylobacter blaseri]PSM51595.1 hypothetical protein CQ405_07305 [Campylobacter blaseri]PSM53388.1 hypothetical protein CRN67_07310 [Campylobacter blaseri]QKF86683.1 Tol-Pal system subunit TolA [Campylobacter blaseri]
MNGSKYSFLNLISLITSIGIYLGAVSLILFFSYSSKILENSIKYTKDKDAYMDIYVMDIDDSLNALATANEASKTEEKLQKSNDSIEEESIKTTHKKVSEVIEKSENKKQETIEAPKKIEEKPKENLLDLFNSADKKKLEEARKKEEEKIQSRKKSDKKTNLKDRNISSKQVAKTKGDKASGRSQRTGVYNKFIGEVDGMLTGIWSTYRAMPNQDALVEITINPNGRATYRILELSYSTEFNQKLRDFLSRVEAITFSKPPDGKAYTHKYKMKDLIP